MKNTVLGGDINLPYINWKIKSTKAGSNHQIQQQQLVDMAQELSLEQMLLRHSRENNILDPYITTYPTLVKTCNSVPRISDHDMEVVDVM